MAMATKATETALHSLAHSLTLFVCAFLFLDKIIETGKYISKKERTNEQTKKQTNKQQQNHVHALRTHTKNEETKSGPYSIAHTESITHSSVRTSRNECKFIVTNEW